MCVRLPIWPLSDLQHAVDEESDYGALPMLPQHSLGCQVDCRQPDCIIEAASRIEIGSLMTCDTINMQQ